MSGYHRALAGRALSPREREVLALIRDYCTDPEVAARLGLSVRTVERHVARMLGKLGVRNRRDMARMG